jgi:hypothetical protein
MKSKKIKLVDIKPYLTYILLIIFSGLYFFALIFIELITIWINIFTGYSLPLIKDTISQDVIFYVVFLVMGILFGLVIRDIVKDDNDISKNETSDNTNN